MDGLKQEFDQKGYVVLRNFVGKAILNRIAATLDENIFARLDTMPREYVFYEDKSDTTTLKQLQHINQFAPYFDELIESDQFRGLAERLLGSSVVARNMQWFNKPPGIGKETPPHQDGYYFMLVPNEALTMWLAIDPVDEENGCVRYISGSNRAGMRPHSLSNILGFSQGISDYREADRLVEIPMIVAPGDMIVHHSLTIHRADANASTRSRRGLGFIYYSDLAREDRVKHAEYQQKLKETLLKQQKI
nr:phytanoyl-CoA dioxygenase family protein [Cytophagales bacterium]